MIEVNTWLPLLFVTTLLSLIGYLLNANLKELYKKIDKITNTLEVHNDRLIRILQQNEATSDWLDGHEQRIDELQKKVHDIELNCASSHMKK